MYIQNSGVKAGGKHLLWPLASLADSRIYVRLYSTSLMICLTLLIILATNRGYQHNVVLQVKPNTNAGVAKLANMGPGIDLGRVEGVKKESLGCRFLPICPIVW